MREAKRYYLLEIQHYTNINKLTHWDLGPFYSHGLTVTPAWITNHRPVKWNYLSIPNLQRWNHWRLGMDTEFHPTLYNGYNCLSMLRLNHFNKGSPLWRRYTSVDSVATGSSNGVTPFRRHDTLQLGTRQQTSVLFQFKCFIPQHWIWKCLQNVFHFVLVS